jgi:hypothetical protein
MGQGPVPRPAGSIISGVSRDAREKTARTERGPPDKTPDAEVGRYKGFGTHFKGTKYLLGGGEEPDKRGRPKTEFNHEGTKATGPAGEECQVYSG